MDPHRRPLATGTAGRCALIVGAVAVVLVLRLTVPGARAVGVGFLFAVPTAMATWWFGRAVGVVVATATIALWVVSAAVVDDYLLGAAAARAAVIAASVVVADAGRRHLTATRAVEDELDAVREALTPPALPALPGLDLAVNFLPAQHGVSGDFYLVTNGPGRTNIAIVGDVCGHGPRAASRAAFARATMASVAASSSDPAEVLRLVNDTLVERWDDMDYVTATCVVHDPQRATIAWATAGHPRPLRLGDLSELGEGAVPLGLFHDAEFTAQEAAFTPPDGLLLYTDGLLDAGRGVERFGQQRVKDALRSSIGLSAREVARALSASVRAFAGREIPDDICVLVLRALPMPAAGPAG